MREKNQKRGKKEKEFLIILLIVFIIILGIFMIKKPTITGLAVITKENIHDDNLNLVIKESKNVSWNLKNPGILKSIKVSGAISRNGSAKVFIGKGDNKILLFDSTKQIFDVNVEVLPDYKKIFQGEELLIQIILFNLRGFGSADVNVKYSIKDNSGKTIAAEEEVINVETQAKFVRKLLIPSDLKAGTYVAFVEVRTPEGLIGTSSDIFEVASRFEEEYSPQIKFYITAIVIVFILFIIIIIAAQGFRYFKKKGEVAELGTKSYLTKLEKLEKEQKTLKQGYRTGFISKESYTNDMNRILKELKKLKK